MSTSAPPLFVMNSSELAQSQCKSFTIDETQVFIVRHQGTVVAYINSCPHRKVPLEWVPEQFLDYDKQFIQCATHGALFTIENGLCISGPCNRQSLTPVPMQEVDGQIVCLGLNQEAS